MLIRCRKLSLFWSIKCIVCTMILVVYMIVLYIGIGLFVSCFFRDWGQGILTLSEIIRQVLIPVLAAAAIGIWQMAVTAAANEVIGMLVSMVYLILSSYYEKWYLLGNYLMKMRIDHLLVKTADYGMAVGCLVAVILVGVLAGTYIFNHADYFHGKGGY